MKFILHPKFRKIVLILSIILYSLNGFTQTKPITLNLKEQPLSVVIKAIEQQTTYRVLFNALKIDGNKKVSVTIKNGALENALELLLKGTDISYVIKDDQIVLIERQAEQTKTFSQEQERTIKGYVFNATDKLPLPGATVLIKGTSAGAVTNIDGEFNYLLKGQDIQNKVLAISFLGFKTLEIEVGTKSNFEIFLEEDFASLDEVVITSSYGTKKLKEEVVGSIVSVNPKDIAIEQAVTAFDELLEGQIAGVLIETNPQLGEPVKINIRGQGSLIPLSGVGTSTQPLIIVDGIILSEETGLDGNNFFDVGESNFSENILNPQ